MSFFKQYLFSIFEKNDKKKNENGDANNSNNQPPQTPTDLSQPEKPSDKDKKNINKKLLIKVLVWVSIVLVIGVIIGVAIWASSDHSTDLTKYNVQYQQNQVVPNNKKPQDILVFDTNNDGNFNVTGNNPDIYVSVNDYDDIINSTFVGSNNKWSIQAYAGNSLKVRFNVIRDNLSSGILYTINNSVFKVLDNTNSATSGVENNTVNNSASSVALMAAVVNNNQPEIINANSKLAGWFSYSFGQAVPPSKGFDWLAFLSLLLPIVLIVLMIYYYSKMMKGASGGSLFGQKDNTYSKVTDIKTKFDDVAGIDEVKNELKEVVDYLKRPQKYTAMGARIPRGLILYGPPGTGKTLIAKAVAGEANVPFYQANGASFDDMFVGSGARRIRDLFAKASKEAPSIIFIDEIDAVAGKRGSNAMISGGGIADQTINELLSQMDGFTTKDNVIVIAATNRIDTLDPAILRPGRFDLQIQVVLPDIDGREAMLKIHARNKNLSSDVNLRDIARRTAGFSGAQLEDVLNEATLLAVRENRTAINTKNIDEAIDRVISGPKRENRVISDEEKMQIAYHEAGHALVGLHSNAGEVVEKITIIPRGQAAGYTMQTPQDQERMIPRKKDMIALIRMALGGRASEAYIFGNDLVTAGASNDLYKVTNIARGMVASYGMGELGLTQYIVTEGQENQFKNSYSETTANLIDQNVQAIISENYDQAYNIIKENKDELELIVLTLLVLETIVKPQIDYIHNNKALPEEVLQHEQELEDARKLIASAPINRQEQ